MIRPPRYHRGVPSSLDPDTTVGEASGDPARIQELAHLLDSAERVVALTGAGCSTRSGIPDYRDESGEWKRTPPMRFHTFISSADARQRYWARSLLGFERVAAAQPNASHRALARLEATGRVPYLLTQNVDGLHQKAGSVAVNDLHGRIDRIRCLDCGRRSERGAFQEHLVALNPSWLDRDANIAPDGDADLEIDSYASFQVPPCEVCGGVIKPDVVFFGESVPPERVDEAMAAVDDAEALVVVGSSLMVWSGYRFVKRASARSIPVASVNLGRTRADGELSLRIEAECGAVLNAVVAVLEGSDPGVAQGSLRGSGDEDGHQ